MNYLPKIKNVIKKTTLLQSNFIEITLRHGCSPVNLLHIFRTLFPKNTSGWLLLNINVLDFENNKMVEEILNQKWLQQEINPLKSHEIKQLLLMISPHKYGRKYSIQGWNHSKGGIIQGWNHSNRLIGSFSYYIVLINKWECN